MQNNDSLSSLLVEARSVVAQTKETIEHAEISLRKDSRLDLILGAHLRRVVIAIESTFILAESGAGHDATVLSRVVLEHAISAVSVAMSGDPERESYLFITAQHRHVRDSHEALKKYYSDIQEPEAEVISSVQNLVEQVDQSGFLERLQKLVTRLDESHSPNEKMFSWLFDVPYRAMSNYVHARALGLRKMAPPLGEQFKFIAEFEEDLCMNAVRHSIIGLLVACLALVHSWAPPSLEQKILGPLEEFVRTAGQAGQFSTFQT